MTYHRIKVILSKVRYKQGWRFCLANDGSYDIEITASVPDAYHPSRKPVDKPHAFVTNAHLIPDTKALLGRLFDACQRLEFHEAGEWFKYRGKRPFDPHR